jgi:N-acetylneuraminate synthase/N,N'-diacetyllegionaminate synthase
LSGFATSFRIDGRTVGADAPCLIIAEAGVSHFGDMGLARELVDLAGDAGADAFKTQIFDVEQLIAGRAGEWRERLRPRNLTFDQCEELQARCRSRGLLFLATAHDESRIEWLKRLDVPAVKVGSGERNNPAFVRALAALGKPMILSTGMCREEDVRQALQACLQRGCREVALLHCVTAYPSPDKDLNLRAMDALSQIAPVPVGWSDHTADSLAVHAAVARGARVIEKHITILRNVANAQDWKVSAGPENFGDLVAAIRRIEVMLGRAVKEPAACEGGGEIWATKSLVAARDLDAGHRLMSGDVVAKRPGDGIRPDRIGEIEGRVLRSPVAADAAIRLDDLM